MRLYTEVAFVTVILCGHTAPVSKIIGKNYCMFRKTASRLEQSSKVRAQGSHRDKVALVAERQCTIAQLQ
jgi:hypothetical protein